MIPYLNAFKIQSTGLFLFQHSFTFTIQIVAANFQKILQYRKSKLLVISLDLCFSCIFLKYECNRSKKIVNLLEVSAETGKIRRNTFRGKKLFSRATQIYRPVQEDWNLAQPTNLKFPKFYRNTFKTKSVKGPLFKFCCIELSPHIQPVRLVLQS